MRSTFDGGLSQEENTKHCQNNHKCQQDKLTMITYITAWKHILVSISSRKVSLQSVGDDMVQPAVRESLSFPQCGSSAVIKCQPRLCRKIAFTLGKTPMKCSIGHETKDKVNYREK